VNRYVGGSPPIPRRSDLARAIRRRSASMFLMLRVYVLLIFMRGVISILSLGSITARLGVPMQETPKDGVREDQLRYARRVGWAIRGAARRTPTNSNCYPQALTAWWLLHRKHIPTTFYYGAAFEEDGTALQAHVWVRCGPLVVTGGGQGRRFAPLTWFADMRTLDTLP
jgi:Transglutaminase-like superfamily